MAKLTDSLTFFYSIRLFPRSHQVCFAEACIGSALTTRERPVLISPGFARGVLHSAAFGGAHFCDSIIAGQCSLPIGVCNTTSPGDRTYHDGRQSASQNDNHHSA